MRIPLAIVSALAVLALGAYQAIASVALAASATPASFWKIGAGPLGVLVAQIEPGALQTQELRRVLGAAALARGDISRAERFDEALRPGAERDVLRGRIAQARGDDAGAVQAFLQAGDLVRVQAWVDALVTAGHVAAAVQLQTSVVSRLEATHAQNDTLAEAQYRSGLIAQRFAYDAAARSDDRASREAASVAAYRRAVRLAPLEDRYRIALANELLNTNDLAAARAEFERVRDLDPTSVEALTGLADAAIRAGDFTTARRELDAARALAPDSAAVSQMAAKLNH